MAIAAKLEAIHTRVSALHDRWARASLGTVPLTVPRPVYVAQLEALEAALRCVELSTGEPSPVPSAVPAAPAVHAVLPEHDVEHPSDRRASMKAVHERLSHGATKSCPPLGGSRGTSCLSRQTSAPATLPAPATPPMGPVLERLSSGSEGRRATLRAEAIAKIHERHHKSNARARRAADPAARQEWAATLVQAQWRGKRVRKRCDGPMFGMKAEAVGATASDSAVFRGIGDRKKTFAPPVARLDEELPGRELRTERHKLDQARSALLAKEQQVTKIPSPRTPGRLNARRLSREFGAWK